MTKKNDVLRAKNPCKHGVKIGMEVLVFAANFAVLAKPDNEAI